MHEQAERKTNLRSRRSSTTSGTTSETTAELRSELSRWCTLLALSTSITSAVSSLTISTTATTSTERLALALTLTTHHSAGRGVRSLLLDAGSWDNLSGEVKPFAEVVKTLRGEGVVVILP